jgi:hypothetical protein
MAERMIKLVVYLRARRTWAEDAELLKRKCAPHIEAWLSGTPVRVCLRAYSFMPRPIYMLNANLEDISYRLESVDGRDALFDYPNTAPLYAMLRPLTLEEWAEL